MVKQPEQLPEPESGLPGDLMQSAIYYANAYHECRRLHSWLIDWVNSGLSDNLVK